MKKDVKTSVKTEIFGVDKDILSLGIVSMFTDISSEAIFSVFSIFFTVILGASTALLGIIEGLSDFSASSIDYFSGWLSDKKGKRKPYAILGYAFSTAAKSLLLFATVTSAAIFRVVERLGKSFRGPPRDAWIAKIAKKSNRGYSFGVHNALDKSGAILGPLLAYLYLNWAGQSVQSFKILFLLALIPAAISIIILSFLKDRPERPSKRKSPFSISEFKKMDDGFKHFVKSASIFSLAYFSFGFLMLKAYLAGFMIKDVVLLYALFNISFVLSVAPIGFLGDRIGRRRIIALEYILYLAMSLGFILVNSKIGIIALFVLFGVFYGIDESQSKAYITDFEKKRRGTAIGMYNFITGMVYVAASVIAGLLWSLNPDYAFSFSALVTLVALVYFLKKK